MPKDKPSVGSRVFSRTVRKTLSLHIRNSFRVGTIAIAITLLASILPGAFVRYTGTNVAQAQTPNTTINFQARILQSTGSLVPDGDYHVEFKIYDSISSGATAQGVCTGNCLWSETRTTGNLVRVVNGYVAVNLGSVTAFPSTMPWSQNLYITMRVGGNGGSASWDTEMTNSGNRMKLNSTPLAYVSNNVASSNTNAASTNSNNISIQSGNALGTTSNSGNITLDTGTATGTTGTITLGATNASALTLGRTGLTTSNAGNLTIQGGTATVGTTSQAGSLVVSDGSSNTGTIIVNPTAGNFTFTIPTVTANDTFCLLTLANCAAASATLQSAYTADADGSDAVITLTSTDGAIVVRDASSTVGNLFVVEANGGTDYLTVTATGTTIGNALTIGSGAGVGLFTNNGATVNTTLALSNFATGGAIGTAAATVDIYSSFSVNQTTSGQTLTLPTPTASTTYGRTIYLANIGTQSFTLLGNIVAPGNAITAVWSNTTGGASWQTSGTAKSGGTAGTVSTAASGGASGAVASKNPYGADYINTSTTSAQTVINTALSNVGAAGGGTVYLMEGTYIVDGAITIPNNTTLAGSVSGTIIKIKNGTNAALNVITNTDTSTGEQVIVRDLIIEGNKSNQSSGTMHGVYINGAGSGTGASAKIGAVISNITVKNARGSGIYLNGSNNSFVTDSKSLNNDGNGIFANNGSRNIFSGNSSLGNGNLGIVYTTGSSSTLTNNIIDTTSGGGEAIFLDAFSYGTVSSNSITGSVASGIYIGTSSPGNSVLGNTITSAAASGISLSSDYTIVKNNVIANSGTSTTNEGIFVSGGSYNEIADNIITDSGCTISCYAIHIDSGTKNSLSNNRFSGSGANAAGIIDTGTNTIYQGQSVTSTNSTNVDVADFRFQGSANSATAFAVRNASGVSVLNVDTSTAGITVTGTATVTSNLTVDTSTLFVNATADFVSVGSTSDLGARLQIVGANDETQLLVRANGTQSMANPLVLLQNSSGTELARINATTSSLFFGNAAGGSSAAGANNTGIGASALGSVSTGTGNTTLGSGALASVSGNNNNTAVGYNAGNLATGGNNIFLGALAGDNVTTGTDNIIIGYNLDASAAGATNELRIGGVLQGNTSTLAAQFNGALTVIGSTNLNGNTTIGDATTDRLTITSEILGSSPFVFQGATDNGNSTTFAFTDPTGTRTQTFQDNSGVVALGTAGNTLIFTTSGATNVTLPTSGTLTVNPTSGSFLRQVPTTTAENTISPTAASVVGLTVNGTSSTAATAVAISQPGAAAGITIASANNTATNGLSFSGTFTNIINSTNFSVANSGAVTAVGVNSGTGLLQGTGGLTVSGAIANINASSNFATNINTGTSTGAVNIGSGSGANAIAIGNSASTTTLLGATNINTTGSTTTTIGNASAALNVNGTTTVAAGFSQTGANTFSTGTGAISFNGATSITGTNTLTVGTGLTSLGGALTVTGLTTLNGGLTIEPTDTFTFNTDAFTDFTGGGLVNTGGVLTVDATSATGFFRNGGNSFGGTAVLGTNDANALAFETGGTTQLTVTTGGNLEFNGTGTLSTSSGDLFLQGSSKLDLKSGAGNSAGIILNNYVDSFVEIRQTADTNGTPGLRADSNWFNIVGAFYDGSRTVSGSSNAGELQYELNQYVVTEGYSGRQGSALFRVALTNLYEPLEVNQLLREATPIRIVLDDAATLGNLSLIDDLVVVEKPGLVGFRPEAGTLASDYEFINLVQAGGSNSRFTARLMNNDDTAFFSGDGTGSPTERIRVKAAGGVTLTGTTDVAGGDFIVDSADNALYVDATGNRVGIGNTGSTGKLSVSGATSALGLFESTGANNAYVRVAAPTSQQAGIEFATNGSTRYQFGAQTDNSLFLYDNANSRDALNLVSGNLSLNTNGGNVTVGNTAASSVVTLNSGAGGTIAIGTGAQARTINIGTGAAAQTVTLGSTDTTSATTVNAGSGGITLGAATTLSTLGTTNNSSYLCRNTSNIIAGCSGTPLTNSLTDNITDAFDLQEGTNNYININTTNSSENISFGNAGTNPSYNFLGSGTLAVAGAQTITGNLTVDTTTFFVDATNNRVAVGTTDVTNAVVTVAGTAPNTANGAGIRIESTLDSTTQNQNGVFVRPTVSPASASTRTYAALNFAAQSSSANISGASLMGIYGGGSFSGTGTLGAAYGAYFQNYNNSTGTIGTSYGAYIDTPSNAGTITSNYGLVVVNQTASTVPNNINLVLGAPTATGNWSIYNQSSYNNALNGNTRIGGVTAPTVALDVTGSGLITAAANTTALTVTGTNLTSANGIVVSSTGAGLTTGSLLSVTSATTSAVDTNGIVSLNATGNYTSTGNAALLDVKANATAAGTVQNIAANALTTGQALRIASTSTGLTTAGANLGSLLNIQASGASTAFTGSLASINFAGTAVGNTGALLNLNSSGAAQVTQSLLVTNASTGAPANGLVRYNFTGTRTAAGVGLQVDDALTTLATAVRINTNTLTTGNALVVSSTGTGLTSGSLLSVTSATTGAVSANGIVSLNATGNFTSASNVGLLNVVANATLAGTVANISGTAVTTGSVLQVTGGTGTTTGTTLNVTNGRVQFTPTNTIASAAGATWNGVNVAATTATLSGATSVTTATGFNLFSLAAPTVTSGSALTVSFAATSYISGAPIQAGSTTITRPYALFVDSGVSRFDGNIIAGDYAGSDTSAAPIHVYTTGTAEIRLTGGSGGSWDAIIAQDASSNFSLNTNNSTNFSIRGSDGNVGIKTTSASADLSFGDTADRTLNVNARSTNAAGNGLTVTAGAAGAGATGFAGGILTLNGGAAAGTTGNANGGNVVIAGGVGVNAGTRGLVVITNPTFQTATVQNFTGSGTITQGNVDASGALLISSNAAGYTATLGDPSITTAGRVVYVTNSGTFDMTLSVNGGGSGNTITLKPSTTATMIWNGTDWTAAGASSSTDLQAAYNNTATSAGGAELVLNAPGGSADGLTIRNNATTPIVGGILEVQTSIGSNLFTVNNNASEFATNGGAETAGGTSSTFPANTWDTTTGGTVDRWTTTGDNVATGQASVRVQATAINHGARNRISTTLTSGLTYTASFAVRGATNFSTLDIRYSPDGTTAGTTQCATAQTVTSGIWTRITCSFVASGTITSSNSMLIRQTDGTTRTFYIDNLSLNTNASANFAGDGSADVATAWGDFEAGAAVTVSLENTIIYEGSGSIEAAITPATANVGIRNNMSITPAVNTQYLVSFYARSTTAMTGSMAVGFLPAGGNSVPTGAAACVDYNTQTLVANTWTKITCLFTTPGAGISNPDLVIYQTDTAARSIFVDDLSITLNTNNSNNVQIGGGNKGGPVTLFTLDRSAGAPIADNNDAYLGSLYYDTTTGRIQCYEADGWGACGAAPDNIVNLNPEYAGAVLNGSGVGTMTADFCANQAGVLQVNHSGASAPCATAGDVRNYYKWTSPQATQQTYSIYVTYQLPATFNGFSSDDTVQLTARVDNTSNASVTYEMFKSVAGVLTQCGTGETNVITGGGGSANTWYSYGINGNEATGCSFNSTSASGFVIFKINMKANSNANAYVSTLSFVTTGR